MIGALILVGGSASLAHAGSKSTPVDWSGVYVGATGGSSFVETSYYNDYNANGSFIYEGSANPDGFVGGLLAGAAINFLSGLVFGIEGHVNRGNTSAYNQHPLENGVLAPDVNDFYELKNTATGRARLGWDAGNFMPFVTAGIGVAWMDGGFDAPNEFGRTSATLVGYTIGGGLEYASSEHLRFRMEYTYSDYGSETVTADVYDNVTLAHWTTDYDVRLSTQTTSFGVIWAF